MSSIRTITIESEFSVEAPLERVFQAYCHEQADWYPHTYGGDRVRSVVVEPRVGGLTFEDWGDGAGHLYGQVSHYDPPKALAVRSRLGTVLLDQAVSFRESGASTVVSARTVTFGDISEEMEQGIRFHGDVGKYADDLRKWIERTP